MWITVCVICGQPTDACFRAKTRVGEHLYFQMLDMYEDEE